jgi:hypothetical protein
MARPHKLKTKEEKRGSVEHGQPVALPIRATARRYGVHETTIWRSIRAGRIKVIYIGKRPLCVLSSIDGGQAAT